MSGVDARETPKMMPGFQSVGREAAHGIIILSLDHGAGLLLEWAACTANVRLHARIVRGYAQRRRLRDIGRAISQRAEDPTLEVAAIVAGARKALADVEPGTAPRCAVEGGA